jgi:hypothetical protein
MLNTPSIIRTPIAKSSNDIATSPIRNHIGTSSIICNDTATSPMKNHIDISPMISNDVATSPMIDVNDFQGEGKVIMTGNLPSEPKYLHIYLSTDSVIAHENNIFFPSLSAENLGPIVLANGEECVNLENLWEFSKVDKSLVDNKEKYLEIRKVGFEDPNYNFYTEDEAFFLFKDRNGNERRYTFLEARFFFCHYYELLVRNKPDFLRLKTLKEDRFNLQLAGCIFVSKTPIEHYIQDKANFDQSMILYCMLTIDDPNNYPWRVASRFGDLYKDMI